MNARRKLFMGLGAASLTPRFLFAQPKKQPVLIGWLHGGTRTGLPVADLKQEMAALGWKDGENYVLELISAEGRVDELPTLAKSLAAKKPGLIVTSLDPATVAAAKAAPNIPVIQVLGGSPVEHGLATSLARPGGMVTGITNVPAELSEKYLELLLAAVPKLKRVGFLLDSNSPRYAAHMSNSRRAADRHRVEARFAEARDVEELDRALNLLKQGHIEGLVLPPSPGLFGAERQRIVKFAFAERWPVVAGPQVFADQGALLSYSADNAARYRRAAYYIDRVLKGAKPGDLPIEQPMTFELSVNLKTAKALNLTMPPEIMVRATRVIQ